MTYMWPRYHGATVALMTSALERAPRDCHHSWQLILLEDGSASVLCDRCGRYDDQEWKGGLLGWVDLTMGDIRLAGGQHNSKVRVQVPVDIFVRQTVSWNRTTGSVVPEMTVKLTPRMADYKIVEVDITAEIEADPEEAAKLTRSREQARNGERRRWTNVRGEIEETAAYEALAAARDKADEDFEQAMRRRVRDREES